MTKALCIYHDHCTDGIAAAWVVRYTLGDGAEYRPANYGAAPPDVRDRDVVIVDFSYKREVLEEMAGIARSVLILDHHKTAADDLRGLIDPPSGGWKEWLFAAGLPSLRPMLGAIFDMRRSGAGLTWDYFRNGAPRPEFIDLIEDRDLWRFARADDSRDFHAWINSFPHSFEIMDNLESDQRNVTKAIQQGAAINRARRQLIEQAVSASRRSMIIAGVSVPVINVQAALTSEACEMVYRADHVPFVAAYYDGASSRYFGLRSADDGMDVGAVAKLYGGGGHPHASGFKVAVGWEGDENAS